MSMFLSSDVANPNIQPCMECCCHIWAGAHNYNLDISGKLQKWVCRTVGPSITASHEPFVHRLNVASLSLLHSYYLGRCSHVLPEIAPLPCSFRESTCCSNRLNDFSVTIRRCCKDVHVKSFFSNTTRLWNYLPAKFNPLTYNLNGFKQRVYRNLLS